MSDSDVPTVASIDELLNNVRWEIASIELDRAQSLLDKVVLDDCTTAQKLRTKILTLNIATRRDLSPSADRLSDVEALWGQAKNLNDPTLLVEVHLLQTTVKATFGLPAAALQEAVSAVALCVLHGLTNLLDFSVMMQSQLLVRAGRRVELKLFDLKWLNCQPPLGELAQATLWSGLGTAEYYEAEEMQSLAARRRCIDAHLNDLQICRRLGNDGNAAVALSNIGIACALAGEMDAAQGYLQQLQLELVKPKLRNRFLPANLTWFGYTEGLYLLGAGQRKMGIDVLMKAYESAQAHRSSCLLPLIKIFELLLQHPDSALGGQDLRAWASELAKLHREHALLEQQVLMKGFDAMVRSAEVAGQNAILRQHSDTLTRELAQRNHELGETVVTLQSEAARRKRAEAALQRANEELELRVLERTEQLQDANIRLARHERLAALSRMVAGIAHRLNTPLGNARLAVETIYSNSLHMQAQVAQPMSRRELNEFIDGTIQSSALAERALGLAADLMVVFKQVFTLEHVEAATHFDAALLVRRVCEFTANELGKAWIPIYFELNGDGGYICFGYPQLLTQALQQIVRNALLHGQKPDLSEGVWVRFSKQGDTLCIVIQDKGLGIAPSKLERIFEPFSNSLTDAGLGLGLHIARNLVTDLGQGSLTVASTEGEGTSFFLQLPMNTVAADPDRSVGVLDAGVRVPL